MAGVTNYGFNLGEISGITSDILTIQASIKTGSAEAVIYNLQYNSIVGTWMAEGATLQEDTHNAGEYQLIIGTFDENDIGDEYTINLSLPEKPTQAFENALQMVGSAFRIEVKFSEEAPNGYLDISAGELYELAKKSMVFYSLEHIESGFYEIGCAFLKYTQIDTTGETAVYSFSFSDETMWVAEGADAYPVVYEG